ncbi:hypothetical protein OH491_27625 (plasmid) [Termitidicoccus mucosus]|uniref:hypothetical protein n=1 Tax=Termitidicoccus mucosus TaxID=1184151 RepID=UPI0031831298
MNDAKSLKLRAENLTKDWSREPRVALEVDYGQRGIVNRNAFGKQVPVNADRILKETNFEKVAKKTVETLENTAKEMGEINTEIAETYERMMRPGIDQQEYENSGQNRVLAGASGESASSKPDVLAYLQAQKTINDTQAAKENEVKTQVQESNDKEVSNQRNQLNVQEIIW